MEWETLNIPLSNDKTLRNCPECGSSIVSHSLLITVNTTGMVKVDNDEKPKNKCNVCGFTSTDKFETLNKINRRTDKINKILDK